MGGGVGGGGWVSGGLGGGGRGRGVLAGGQTLPGGLITSSHGGLYQGFHLRSYLIRYLSWDSLIFDTFL